MQVDPKPYNEMTLAELRAEQALWDDRIAKGVFNGALAGALTCRNLCAGWIARRETQAMGRAA